MSKQTLRKQLAKLHNLPEDHSAINDICIITENYQSLQNTMYDIAEHVPKHIRDEYIEELNDKIKEYPLSLTETEEDNSEWVKPPKVLEDGMYNCKYNGVNTIHRYFYNSFLERWEDFVPDIDDYVIVSAPDLIQLT